MGKDELVPSESEWQIMEILWEYEELTSSEVISRLPDKGMNPKMVRVLMNRLCQKGIIAYRTDERDSRVYHYYPLKTREECLKEKSRKFVDSYFGGNQTGAVAALLQSVELSETQLSELEAILEQSRKKGKKDN